MTNPNKSLVAALLDRSGSMETVEDLGVVGLISRPIIN